MSGKKLKYLGLFFVAILAWFFFSEPGFFVLEKTRNIKPQVGGKGLGVYYINLDSSLERKKDLLPRLQALGYPYERISAVEGRRLSQEKTSKVFDSKFRYKISHNPMTKGQLGCYLSQIKALETFVNSNYKYAIIFEDDIMFEPKVLKKLVDEILNKDNDKVDIIYLHRTDPRGKTIKIATLGDGYGEFRHLRKFGSAAAYLLNKKAASSILNYAYPIKLPFDDYISRTWELQLQEVLIKPLPTKVDTSKLSEIAKRGRPEGYIKPKIRLTTILNKVKFSVKTKIAREYAPIYYLLKNLSSG